MTIFSSAVSPEGRVVIPAPIRKALALNPGDTVTFRIEGDHAVLTSRSAALAQLQAMFTDVEAAASDTLWSDELVAERRVAAAREASEV